MLVEASPLNNCKIVIKSASVFLEMTKGTIICGGRVKSFLGSIIISLTRRAQSLQSHIIEN